MKLSAFNLQPAALECETKSSTFATDHGRLTTDHSMIKPKLRARQQRPHDLLRGRIHAIGPPLQIADECLHLIGPRWPAEHGANREVGLLHKVGLLLQAIDQR